MVRRSICVFAGVLGVLLLAISAMASDSSRDAEESKPAAPDPGAATTPDGARATGTNSPSDALLGALMSKGVLSLNEVNSLAAAPPAELRQRLLLMLKEKGILSDADMKALKMPVSAATSGSSLPNAEYAAEPKVEQASGPPQTPKTPPPSGPIPAVTPLRVLQVDPPKREGFIPDIKIGKGVNIKPYGFFKVSAIYDTSSPYGNDFPLPGFIGDINGPDAFPEFHVKARFIRFGSNFEWLDTPNVVITGKVEADFEGNFGRSNNRNISTVRSNMFQVRLGYARIDWKHSETNSFFFLAGQDWTPFGSSTLPNLFESTGLGIGFGTLYERAPQFRVGAEHRFGGNRKFAIGPEFAIVLPAYGNLPSDIVTAGTVVPNGEGIGNQLGFGERQGADSGKPEIQARFVTQFQLDGAPGVAPAQIIVSGVHGTRTATVLAASVPAAFKAAFPTGAQVESDRNAWTGEIQLPTRFATVIAKYWNGSDLRFYFVNQLLSNFNDTTGLTATETAQSVDGSSTVIFGLLGGVPTIAPQRPVRGQGGFVNVGFPLSRWANADPAGRNAGWQLYLHYGLENALARDVRRVGGGRQKSDLAAGTLYYKLNNFVTFGLEESYYRTRAIPLTATGVFPAFEGRPNREWKDIRTEFGPIFTF
jgi:hypothetical protein